MEMFDQVLYGSSSWSDIGVDKLGDGWGGFGGGGGYEGILGSMWFWALGTQLGKFNIEL